MGPYVKYFGVGGRGCPDVGIIIYRHSAGFLAIWSGGLCGDPSHCKCTGGITQ